MAAVGADMRRQSVQQVAHRCAHCLRPRLHARPVAVDRPDVLALRFLIRQLSKLSPATDRALDSSPFGLTHALGRPTTALNPAYPFDARTQRASSLLAPTCSLLVAEIATFQFISVVAQIEALPEKRS